MALTGTILPSISTFSAQKEKCWENVSSLFLFISQLCSSLFVYVVIFTYTYIYTHILKAFSNNFTNYKSYIAS